MREIIILTFLMSLFGLGCLRSPDINVAQEVKSTSTRSNVLMPIPNTFIDPQKFASTNSIKSSGLSVPPLAGVVNHHDLAADLQAKFFKTLKRARPDLKTLIIISPDHFKAGQSVSTHELAYSTPAGMVETDQIKVQALVKDGVWDATDARAFENEHGVGSLAPFMARDLPGVKIVPVFIRANTSSGQLSKLIETLKRIQDEDTFIIVSSDMSHGLPVDQARIRDVQTLDLLEQMNPADFEDATDSNTDSGLSLFVLASLLVKPEFNEIAHANSSDYVSDTKNTTSYIVGFWK